MKFRMLVLFEYHEVFKGLLKLKLLCRICIQKLNLDYCCMGRGAKGCGKTEGMNMGFDIL